MIHAMLAQNETDAALKKVITTHIYDTQGVEQALQEVSYICYSNKYERVCTNTKASTVSQIID